MGNYEIKTFVGPEFLYSSDGRSYLKINDIRKELEDLDKEKVLKIAKQKGKQIVKKSEELYKLAVEKGTPVLERAADEIRLSAIDVLNSITKKLEKKD